MNEIDQELEEDQPSLVRCQSPKETMDLLEPSVQKCHPNSLQARAERDPELKEKLRLGRLRALEEAIAFEEWYRRGCVP